MKRSKQNAKTGRNSRFALGPAKRSKKPTRLDTSLGFSNGVGGGWAIFGRNRPCLHLQITAAHAGFRQGVPRARYLHTLSLPLAINGRPLGAMNLYAASEDAFDESSIETAGLFVAQASIVLANAQAYWDARLLGEQLGESIAHREIIEQAKGIILSSMRCSADPTASTTSPP